VLPLAAVVIGCGSLIIQSRLASSCPRERACVTHLFALPSHRLEGGCTTRHHCGDDCLLPDALFQRAHDLTPLQLLRAHGAGRRGRSSGCHRPATSQPRNRRQLGAVGRIPLPGGVRRAVLVVVADRLESYAKLSELPALSILKAISLHLLNLLDMALGIFGLKYSGAIYGMMVMMGTPQQNLPYLDILHIRLLDCCVNRSHRDCGPFPGRATFRVQSSTTGQFVRCG
jgi:hypothetical protein